MLWLLTLPIRLAIGLVLLPLAIVAAVLMALVWLPFVLLKFGLKLLVGIALLPFVLLLGAVAGLVAFLAMTVAVLIPLAPLFVAAFFIWVLLRVLIPRPAVI